MSLKMLFEIIIFLLRYNVIYTFLKTFELIETLNNSIYNKNPQCYNVFVNNTQICDK